MSNIAIIYKSKYGSTEQYAKWLAEETGADLFNVDDAKRINLPNYDTIVFGGCINAGGIKGIEFLKKNIKALAGKRIIAFAVGLNVDNEQNKQQCIEINFVKKLEGIPCHFLPGAYDPAKVSGFDKALMGVVKKMADSSSPDGKLLVDAIENGADFIDKNRLAPLIADIQACN